MLVMRLFRVEEKLIEDTNVLAKTDFRYSVLATFW
jgi:hypothetical protein